MSELSTRYPLVWSLFTDLFELKPGDEQLPLELLVRSHAALLRRPLHGIATLTHGDESWRDVRGTANAEDLVTKAKELLCLRYPSLVDGLVYADSTEVEAALQALFAKDSDAFNRHMEDSDALFLLIEASESRWTPYDPAAILYALANNPVYLPFFLDLIEACLAEHEDVRVMLLDMAGVLVPSNPVGLDGQAACQEA